MTSMIPQQAASLLQQMRRRKRTSSSTQVMVVASGKGGVGKTNIAVNLAITLSEQGRRVMLIDADLGLGNIETICGLRCAHHLGHFLAGEATIEQIIEPGPAGIWCASGGSAMLDQIEFDRHSLARLLHGLESLPQQPELILIDLPAGLGESVRASIYAARDILLVTTPEPTALTDAYALIKVSVHQNPTVRIHVVINRALNRDDGERGFQRLQTAATNFLGIRLRFAGLIPLDQAVVKAVSRQYPFALGSPVTPASHAVRRLAQDVSRQVLGKQSVRSFLGRLLNQRRGKGGTS